MQPGLTAPGRAQAIADRCEALPPDRALRLAYRWIDWSVRAALPDALERAALLDIAAELRSFPPILDADSFAAAHLRFGEVRIASDDGDANAAYFGLAAGLQRVAGAFNLFEAAFTAVMASRLSYGDDRVVAIMERDVAAGWN